jgi:hypothetical protein
MLFFFFVVIAAPVRTTAQDAVSEYQVKAAYVFNFLKFVEYPTDSFADPLAPLIIGVLGDDPFGNALPQVVIGKTVGGARPGHSHLSSGGRSAFGAYPVHQFFRTKKTARDFFQPARIKRPHRG